jgi:hypothetical protein
VLVLAHRKRLVAEIAYTGEGLEAEHFERVRLHVLEPGALAGRRVDAGGDGVHSEIGGARLEGAHSLAGATISCIYP